SSGWPIRISSRNGWRGKNLKTPKPLKHRGKEETEEMELNEITGQIISAALKVHTAIGPGLLESVYQTCLQHELEKAGLVVRREVALPILYDDLRIDGKFKIDMLVEDCVIVELKCADPILPIHKAQLLTYLR